MAEVEEVLEYTATVTMPSEAQTIEQDPGGMVTDPLEPVQRSRPAEEKAEFVLVRAYQDGSKEILCRKQVPLQDLKNAVFMSMAQHIFGRTAKVCCSMKRIFIPRKMKRTWTGLFYFVMWKDHCEIKQRH